MQLKRASSVVAGLLLTAGLGLTSVASANPGPGGPMGGQMGGAMGGPGMMMGKGGHGLAGALNSIKADLKLTDSQKALWDTAEAKGKALHARVKEQRKAGMAELNAALATGNPDFRALATKRDAVEESNKPFKKDVQDAWLNVYDKLDATQRKLVADRMKARLDRIAQFMQRRGGEE